MCVTYGHHVFTALYPVWREQLRCGPNANWFSWSKTKVFAIVIVSTAVWWCWTWGSNRVDHLCSRVVWLYYPFIVWLEPDNMDNCMVSLGFMQTTHCCLLLFFPVFRLLLFWPHSWLLFEFNLAILLSLTFKFDIFCFHWCQDTIWFILSQDSNPSFLLIYFF